MGWLTDPLSAPYFQRALAEVLLLSVPCGLLGSWIVLRRLAFFSHAVGTAAFPGLVLAARWGVAPQVAALASALGFSAGLEGLARRGADRGLGTDATTGLALVAALGLGVVLASGVFRSGAGVDRLLFGTLLGLSDGDLRFAALVAAATAVAAAALRRRWLGTAFGPGSARTLGLGPAVADRALLAAIAVTVVAALPAAGALLASALLVVPAATVRLVAPSVPALQAGSVGLAAAEGAAGLWLADAANAPPGPAIALLAGAAYVAVATGSAARRAQRLRATAEAPS